jgi:L-threonylcarbamoyladenylate synthase
VLGRPLAAADAQSPRAAGTLDAHYAPTAPVHLFEAPGAPPAPARPGQVIGVYSRAVFSGAADGWLWRRMPDEAAAAAHELFAALRHLDDAGVAAIWVEAPPSDPAWDGVRDRLRRAAHAATS